MPDRGPTNPELKKLISLMSKQKEGFYLELSRHLSKSRRQKVSVNLRKIDKIANSGDVVIVPGKVLSDGELTKPVKIYAWRFSGKTADKITRKGGSALALNRLMETKEKGRIVV